MDLKHVESLFQDNIHVLENNSFSKTVIIKIKPYRKLTNHFEQ